MSELPKFRHILVVEDRKGRRLVSLEDNHYSIGRDSNNSIVLYDYQVSRIHATLIKKMVTDDDREFCYTIMDGDLQGKRSTNGLIINGQARISHELKHGDKVRFAPEANANYYIISTESGIDLFDPDSFSKITLSKITLTDEDNPTVIGKPEEDKETNHQDQEELIRLASFPELSPNPIVEIDWDGNLTYLNPAASIKFDTIYEEKLKHPILDGLLSESNSRQGNLFLREVKIESEVFEQYVHYLSEKKLIRSYIYDFTKRKQIEASLRESEARYRAVVRQTSDGIFLVYVSNKRIIEANDAYCKLLGYNDEEISQLTLYNVIASDLNSLNQDLDKVLNDKQDHVEQYLHRCRDGSLINLESSVSLISYRGKDIFCFVVRDLQRRKLQNDHIYHETFHDLLTQLPNQKLFNEQLNIAVANAKRYRYFMSIIAVEVENLEKFKEKDQNNKSEQLLRNFAEGFKSCLRGGDLAARWDNEKFVALLSRVRGPRDPVKVAKRMSEILKQYLVVEGEETDLKLNIGVVVYPLDGDDSSSLVKNALLSLEQNKKTNQGNFALTGFTITPKTASVLKLENLISNGIKEQQFFLCYQPQINLHTTKLSGIEALLRWENPELGQVPPSHFLRLAEDTDLMIPLGKWVIQNGCMQAKAWLDNGFPSIPIGINLSPKQFQQSNLAEMIGQILEQTGLPPELLELEITEKCLSQNYDFAGPTLSSLRELGVRLCLDDFGTGNSSLGYLEQFPFQTVKIGQDLIGKVFLDYRHNHLISAILTVSHGFDLRVIAEGVETTQQLELLRSLQCEEIQGNLFSRPLNVQDATQFLKRGDHAIIT
jgi:diguanylate cyclase (GGDEF)-like protein/PAS domain S-box-containing protein